MKSSMLYSKDDSIEQHRRFTQHMSDNTTPSWFSPVLLITSNIRLSLWYRTSFRVPFKPNFHMLSVDVACICVATHIKRNTYNTISRNENNVCFMVRKKISKKGNGSAWTELCYVSSIPPVKQLTIITAHNISSIPPIKQLTIITTHNIS